MNYIDQEEIIIAVEPKKAKSYKQLFGVYGTLRLDQGNYKWCLEGRSDYLGTIKTEPCYTMYSLGGFPAVAERGETAITIDIFGTNDDEAIRSVNNLEGHIGRNRTGNWYDTCDIETPWGIADMFIMNSCRNRDIELVESGDWLRR